MAVPLMMSRSSPIFSVVLCTYNRAHLLPNALDSLLAQTEADWEALIVDDGSTDRTLDIVRNYLERDKRLRYIYHRNRGLALSRNVGIAAACGRYVTFLDSDDWYRPEHLETRRRILETEPHLDLLHGGCEILGDSLVPDKHNPQQMIDLHGLTIGGTFVFRRESLLDIGGFPDVPFSIDSALFERAEVAGLRILRTDASTYVYDRTPPDSMLNIIAQGGVKALEEYRETGRIFPQVDRDIAG